MLRAGAGEDQVGGEINDTFCRLFMAATNPVPLSWMRNWPPTWEGGDEGV